MASVAPFHAKTLERAIEKLAKEEPLTVDEGTLVRRRIDMLTQGEMSTILRAFDDAPSGEPLSPEAEEECRTREEELLSGRVKGAPHGEVQRKLDAKREVLGA
ncbi:MAG: hypothetical protein U0359_26970 [Byssovorax sp.]